MENKAFESDDGTQLKERIGHEGVGGSTGVRGRGPGLQGAEGQAEGKPPGLEGGKPAPNDAINLERRVGLLSGVALIVGTMIGSGIFVSPKGLLERTGSVALSLIVWAACGILSLLGALAYAELGTLVSESGGEYAYYLQGFSPKKVRHTWWAPIPAFLFAWVSVFLLKPSSLAIICLTCAEYFMRIFSVGSNGCLPPELSVKLFAATIIILITFINSYSVNLATRVQNIFTAAKLLAILIIVVGGVVKLAQGNTTHLAKGFEGSTSSFGDIATAFYSGLWAYDGWNNLNYVTEELKKPYTNLPRAIIIGLPLVTVCYLLVNVSYLAVMSTDELLASETVAVLFGDRLFGNAGQVVMIIAVVMSTFGAANGSCFTSARLCFVAAREGHMVDVLSFVHTKKLTPSPALLFNASIALIMVIPSDIGSLIDFFSFTAWIFYGGAMTALLVMRYTMPDAPRPYKVPIIIPIIVLVISVYLVVGPIIDSPQIEYLYATLFIVAGLFFYFPFVHLKKALPGMGHVTTFFQLLLEVVPTDVMPDP
ncbi:b(0,+)-type amino acid transporter 1-like isoform X1 [Eriocheir sinensis]|uniref:b(0,+)-type amino acid transporter 1-like isoform X1 n=1 Tax=Eriocheir sinensis TaxID=95602 RepID=UPI0021CA2B9B|nr:b(0,+)-type amino acid transporter 1-like isoform X1 [Eriocheir sinensis]XP_050740398.1 b(0,+)-type amino acid transporter 1-like isoform X1 [Eriocheir sinensis]